MIYLPVRFSLGETERTLDYVSERAPAASKTEPALDDSISAARASPIGSAFDRVTSTRLEWR